MQKYKFSPGVNQRLGYCKYNLQSLNLRILSCAVDSNMLILAVKSLKRSEMNKKGRKTAEKNVSTSFRVLQAP